MPFQCSSRKSDIPHFKLIYVEFYMRVKEGGSWKRVGGERDGVEWRRRASRETIIFRRHSGKMCDDRKCGGRESVQMVCSINGSNRSIVKIYMNAFSGGEIYHSSFSTFYTHTKWLVLLSAGKSNENKLNKLFLQRFFPRPVGIKLQSTRSDLSIKFSSILSFTHKTFSPINYFYKSPSSEISNIEIRTFFAGNK